VDRHPGRAGALRRAFAARLPERADGAEVLAMTDPRLRGEVCRPFADPATLVGYARQHLEFWSHDATAGADRVRVPVLFCAGEYDRMVTPAGIRDAARHFPGGRFALLPGATHYRMFDRPDLVAALVDRFLREPDRVGEPPAQH